MKKLTGAPALLVAFLVCGAVNAKTAIERDDPPPQPDAKLPRGAQLWSIEDIHASNADGTSNPTRPYSITFIAPQGGQLMTGTEECVVESAGKYFGRKLTGAPVSGLGVQLRAGHPMLEFLRLARLGKYGGDDVAASYGVDATDQDYEKGYDRLYQAAAEKLSRMECPDFTDPECPGLSINKAYVSNAMTALAAKKDWVEGLNQKIAAVRGGEGKVFLKEYRGELPLGLKKLGGDMVLLLKKEGDSAKELVMLFAPAVEPPFACRAVGKKR